MWVLHTREESSGRAAMEPKIKVDIVRERSFDPTFLVRIGYESETVRLIEIPVMVVRRAPRVTFDFPQEISGSLSAGERAKLELAIMNSILAFIMNNAERGAVTGRSFRM